MSPCEVRRPSALPASLCFLPPRPPTHPQTACLLTRAGVRGKVKQPTPSSVNAAIYRTNGVQSSHQPASPQLLHNSPPDSRTDGRTDGRQPPLVDGGKGWLLPNTHHYITTSLPLPHSRAPIRQTTQVIAFACAALRRRVISLVQHTTPNSQYMTTCIQR